MQLPSHQWLQLLTGDGGHESMFLSAVD